LRTARSRTKEASAGASGARNGTPKRGRKGKRAEQVLAAVAKRPGITAGEIAKSLRVKPNYLYKVIGDLEKQGRLRKKGRQLFEKG
jgi:predicted transcriptional regulator